MSGVLDDFPCVSHRFDMSSPRQRFVTYTESMPRGSFRELIELSGSQLVVVNGGPGNIRADEQQ